MKWNRLFSSFVPLRKQNPALGAIASGAAGFVSSLFSQSAQAEENQKNRDWQEMMWNKTNEYNSPKNQRKLLEEAGYNPYLYGNDYQGSGASQPGSPSSSPLPGLKSGVGEGLDMFYKGRSVEQQDTALALQALQVQSNTELNKMKSLESIADTMRNLYKDGGQEQVDQFMENYAPLLKSLNWENSYYDKQMQREFKAKDIANERADLEKELISKYGDKEYQKKLAFIDQQINESKEKIHLMRSEGQLNRAKVEELGSEIARNMAQAGLFSAEGSQISALLPYMRTILEDDSLRSDMDFQEKQAPFMGNIGKRQQQRSKYRQTESGWQEAVEHNYVTDFMRGVSSALPDNPIGIRGKSNTYNNTYKSDYGTKNNYIFNGSGQ